MNGDIRELYQQMIMDHNKNPRNFHAMTDADRTVEGYNPLCGDHFKVYLRMEGDVIKDISFDGSGCAISKSSASVMTDIVTSVPVPSNKINPDIKPRHVTAARDCKAACQNQ